MIFLALLISTAVASPLLGKEQCAKGPPYWCQNIKAASACGAVAHCRQNVWSKPQVKSIPCDLCKEVLTVVEQVLKDNGTQAEILRYLEKACELIPEPNVAAECKDMLDSYYPILVDFIVGELDDPAVVCAALGICTSQQKALGLAQLLSNEIPQVDLSKSSSPFLLNVPQLLYPQPLAKEEAPKQEAGDVCKDCVKFITSLQSAARDNATYLDGLIATIMQQCDLLGPGISDMCKQYVSQYANLVLLQLMSMKPQDICAGAGFCPALRHSVPMQTLVAAKVLAVELEKPAEAKPVELKPAKKMMRLKDPPQCQVCELVMKSLEEMLQDKASEDAVIHAVEKVCSLLPGAMKAHCKDLVETYGEAIIDLLVQEVDPKTVCTVLGLCRDARRTFVPVLDRARYEQGALCTVCKEMVTYLADLLENNATEARITQAVEMVCNFLPEVYRTECDQLVEEYEPLLVQLLIQSMEPNFVCMKVGACPEAKAVVKLLGAEECSWGPAFWCKNMDTASRCNAVDHCRRHVWN